MKSDCVQGNQIRTAKNLVERDIEGCAAVQRSINTVEMERDQFLDELAQQVAEMQAVEEELQKVETEKAALLENLNGNF